MTQQYKAHILLVDDDKNALEAGTDFLAENGYQVFSSPSGQAALLALTQGCYDLVISDLQLGDLDGLEVMKRARELHPALEVIIVTGYATVSSAVQAMSQGAYYYLAKPFKSQELLNLISQATRKTRCRRDIRQIQAKIMAQPHETRFIGENPAIRKLKETIAHVAQLDCNILITGETGTGKELVARKIFELSPRLSQRFLPINCGAMSEELILNELFGHDKDAFTGAGKMRQGLLESVSGGAVLLDEIGEMPLAMQVKLLRVLQEKKIIRVGGTQEIDIDVRILAATNRDLKEEVEKGTFRQDLFYRLNVVTLHIPPLRERRDDIPRLAYYFLAKYATQGESPRGISEEALICLQKYSFPGNARELENLIERALAICPTGDVQVAHLPIELQGQQPQIVSALPTAKPVDVHKSLEENEREYIQAVLESVDGNRTQAAKVIGIDRVSLWRKLKKFETDGFALL